MLTGHDRSVVGTFGGAPRPMTLKTGDALRLCEAYGATLEDFEKIIMVEEELYPILSEKWNKKDS